MEKLDHSCVAGGNVTWKQFETLGNSLSVSLKTKLATTIHPAVILLGIYPRKMETYVHTQKKTCTQMFIAALLIITQTWKQPDVQTVQTVVKQTVGNPHCGREEGQLQKGNRWGSAQQCKCCKCSVS